MVARSWPFHGRLFPRARSLPVVPFPPAFTCHSSARVMKPDAELPLFRCNTPYVYSVTHHTAWGIEKMRCMWKRIVKKAAPLHHTQIGEGLTAIAYVMLGLESTLLRLLWSVVCLSSVAPCYIRTEFSQPTGITELTRSLSGWISVELSLQRWLPHIDQ